MIYSVPNLDATYTIEAAITDSTLTGRYIVRVSGRFLGVADSMRDAKCAAQIHAILLGGATLH